MIRTICDFCEKPIPTYIEQIDRAGWLDEDEWEEDGRGRFVEEEFCYLSRAKDYNTNKLFPHLCEACAGKIDKLLVAYRAEVMKQCELSAKFAEINKKRRKNLGTNG